MTDEADLLRKIQGLLAKAEGTDNEHEASAFFDKAHELMVKYAIDEARVRAEAKRLGTYRTEPLVEDFMFSSYGHHAQAKESLLDMVAKSHSVHSLPYANRKGQNEKMFGFEKNRGLQESKWTRLVGYREDIEAVKLLYLSLLVQSQRFAAEDWRRAYGNAKYSSEGLGKFTWLSGHMDGFAARIGERFRELTEVIYRSALNGRELIHDKDADVLEWMYAHHLATRPKTYCWAIEPEDSTRTKGHKRGTTWYCIKQPDSGHPEPHVYNYKPTYSTYRAVGRVTSREGRSAGHAAANRADIGLTRTAAPLRGVGSGN